MVDLIEDFTRVQGLQPSERLVAYMLAHSRNYKTGQCNPSISRLAQITSLSERAVQYAIQKLIQSGHISKAGFFQKTPMYIIHPRINTGATIAPINGSEVQSLHPAMVAPVQPLRERGATIAAKGAMVAPKPEGTGKEPEIKTSIVLNGHGPKPIKPAKLSKSELLAEECKQTSARPLPPELNVPEFAEHWRRWCEWRTRCAITGTPKGAKPPWTENAARRSISKFLKLGIQRSIEAIEHSLDRWEDAYEPTGDELALSRNGNARLGPGRDAKLEQQIKSFDYVSPQKAAAMEALGLNDVRPDREYTEEDLRL